MEFYDVLARRRSIRAYRSIPIPAAKIERLAEAVAVAPSGCNRQPWKILFITNPELLDRLCEACPQPMLRTAPAVAVALGNPEAAWHRPEGDSNIAIDIGIAFEHLILAAAAEGLAACWVCAYDMVRAAEALQTAAPWRVYAVAPVGYPAEEPAPIRRKPVSEIFEVIA